MAASNFWKIEMQTIKSTFVEILKNNSKIILDKYPNITHRALNILKQDLIVKEEDVMGFCGGWAWFVKDNPECNKQDSFGLVIAQNPFTMSVAHSQTNPTDELMLKSARELTNNSFNFINIYPFRYYKLKNGVLDLEVDIPLQKLRWKGSEELVRDILSYVNPKRVILIGIVSQRIYDKIKTAKYKYVETIKLMHPSRKHKKFLEQLERIKSDIRNA